MPERIVIHILAEDFAAFKKLMPDEPRLGGTYKEWLLRAKETRRTSEAVTEVTIRPNEFELYCLQIGQVPNYYVLEALAATKTRRR